MTTSTVLVTDYNYGDLSIERDIFEDTQADIEIATAEATTESEVIEAATAINPDALLVQYAPITAEVLEAIPNLSVIGRYGVGVDNVDISAATDREVIVLNVPDYCHHEVAEHALALILNCVRNVSRYDRAVRGGNWDWETGTPIHRLAGSTVGLVGFGDIPRHLATKLGGLGIDIIGYDPYVSEEEFESKNVEKVSFEDLCRHADIVSLHAPLTEETNELLDADAFRAMSDTTILVNTARGGLVDIDALETALRTGNIAAAGLDVLPDEPPDEIPLTNLESVVLTPHTAWYSEESIITLRQSLAHDVVTALLGERPENPVNGEALE